LDADRVPVAEGNLPVGAAAADAGGTALLLAAVDPIREPVVGTHVVELGCRLVVPTAPGLPAVDGDRRPLVGCHQDDLRLVGVDPDGVIVVAAGRSADADPSAAAVDRAVEARVRHVNDIGVLRIDFDLCEVAAAASEARLGC